MSASKKLFAAFLAFTLIVGPAAYAEDYVILTPNGTSAYYSAPFNQTAYYINSALSPNSTIVTFDTMPDAAATSSVAAKNPKYIYLVVQAVSLTPKFMNDVDNLTKSLDSDIYADAAWSIITGYDNLSAKSLFDTNMSASWSANYAFVPGNANAQSAAGSYIASRLGGTTAAFGANATSTLIRDALGYTLPNHGDLVYFSGNTTNYLSNTVQLYAGDGTICPATDVSSGVVCNTYPFSVKNVLFFVDTSDAGRVNDTNTDTTWLSGNDAANSSISLPVAFSRITNTSTPNTAAAYIGPHSTRWATSENVVKLFVSSLGQGGDISYALRFAKNAILFNKKNESLLSSSNFTEFLESEYNLFGKAHKPSSAPTPAYNISFSRVHEQNPVIYSGNVTNITWNATATVSASNIAALYSPSGWSSSDAVAWYRNAVLTASKVNISFVAALMGEIMPDTSAIIITSYSAPNLTANITAFNISVNQTDTIFVAAEQLIGTEALRFDKDKDRIYFARLFSPNQSSSASFSVSINYTTNGIRINRTGISNLTNNTALSEAFSTINPAVVPISNTRVYYAVPNATLNCTFASSNCTLFDSGTARYANVTFASVSSGTVSNSLQYNTALDNNVTVNYLAFNRNETISVASNMTSAKTEVLDYNVRLIDAAGKIAWSATTEDISAGATLNATMHNYTIPQNMTNGTYTLKAYYLSNGTELYASYDARSIQISDALNVTNATFTWRINASTDYYFNVTDNMTVTGSVKNVRGQEIPYAQVNISLLGVALTNATTSSPYGYYTAAFNWTGDVGNKTLQVTASYNNNTGAKNNTIYLTRFIRDNITVTLDRGPSDKEKKRIYNSWEYPVVTVNVKDPSNLPVYVAEVGLSMEGAASANASLTGLDGIATMTFDPSESYDTLHLTVTARSPLNTSKVITNNTESVDIRWIKKWNNHFVTSTTPASIVKDSQATFNGNITVSGSTVNTSLITARTLTFRLMAGGSDVTNLSSCSSTPTLSQATGVFSLYCTPKTTGLYDLDLFAGLKYDGVQIYTNDSYVFTVTSNGTTTPPTTTGGGDTQSSVNNAACTTNSDCTSGDYCSGGVCTAISCPDGAIVNHACVPNKRVNITSYPPSFELEQGTWGVANFTVANNGFVGLTGAVFTLYPPTTVAWGTKWYSFVTPMASAIDAGADKKVSVNISVPENASIEQYLIKAKVTTKEGVSDEKLFALNVAPSAKNRDILKESFADLGGTIDDLEREVKSTMKGVPEDQRNLTNRKLEAIQTLYGEIESAMSAGKYFEAYTKQKELTEIIADMNVILADQKAKDAASRSRRNMIAGVVVVLAAIAGGAYYLWTPAPASGYHGGGSKGFAPSAKGGGQSAEAIAGIKKRISELISRFKKQEGTKRYDYLKPPASRW